MKEFEIEKEKKNEFKILSSLIQNFTQEFMNFCSKFINYFKLNTYKIIKDFDIKENNPIGHINFIVIGKAGCGKSTFINNSLLLSEDKRAKEGIGISVTKESTLYSSDKLKMIRMWDTQGLDYQVTQEYILNEITRIVEDGLKKGPDHYINIILYCTYDDRFQNEDGELIHKIMKLYPSDNLPVVITQLKSYFKKKAKEMEKTIRNILDNYLDHKIVEKIEIKSIVSRDFKDEDSNFEIKAYGIPELLRLSFDIMGRSISSATCKNISRDIENLCRDFMDKKILYVQNIFKYEMEILEVTKSLYVDDLEDDKSYLGNKKKKKELSEFNIYRNIENPNYFLDNFCRSLSDKFKDIFNNLESENMPLDEIKIEKDKENEEEKEKQENNIKENKKQENNNEQNNINENIQQENNQNENNEKEEEKENEENKNQENEKQIENVEEKKEVEDGPGVIYFIEKRLEKIRKILDEVSNKTFKKIFKKRYQNYSEDLRREQSKKNEEFHDKSQIIDDFEVEKNFKEKLLPYFKNEYFKIFFCIILKLFMNNLNDIFEMYIQKELKENKNVQKIISQKAENSLKSITEKLKKDLISELDDFMKVKLNNNEFDN